MEQYNKSYCPIIEIFMIKIIINMIIFILIFIIISINKK